MSKVQIGSKYYGPDFDRPCLRAMPVSWRLEETQPAKHQGDKWVWIVVSLVWLFAITQTILEWSAK